MCLCAGVCVCVCLVCVCVCLVCVCVCLVCVCVCLVCGCVFGVCVCVFGVCVCVLRGEDAGFLWKIMCPVAEKFKDDNLLWLLKSLASTYLRAVRMPTDVVCRNKIPLRSKD